MTLHVGKIYQKGDVVLGGGDLNKAKENNLTNYTDQEWNKWREKALKDEDVYYFSIYYKDLVVGEIFLHDIDKKSKEALVGYHIFNLDMRNKGIGTTALKLLQEFTKESGKFKKLTIITGQYNNLSRKISEKCNFTYIGKADENPRMVVYEWSI